MNTKKNGLAERTTPTAADQREFQAAMRNAVDALLAKGYSVEFVREMLALETKRLTP